jgi:hypothetical protein
MAGRNLALAALRTLDRQIQGLAGFVHRQVQQIEKEREPATPDPEPVQPEAGGPPAHWLERVRQAAPGFLDAPSGQSFQTASEPQTAPAITAVPAKNEGQTPETKSPGSKIFRPGEHPKKSPELTANAEIEFENPLEPDEIDQAGSISGGESIYEGESRAGAVAAGKKESRPGQQHYRRAEIVFPDRVYERSTRSSEQPPVAFERNNLSLQATLSGLNSVPEPQDRKKQPGISLKEREGKQTSPKPAGFPSELLPETKEGREIVEIAEFPSTGQPDQPEQNANLPAERKPAFTGINYKASRTAENVYSRQSGKKSNFSFKTESELPLNPPAKANPGFENYFSHSGNAVEIENGPDSRNWSKSWGTERGKTVAEEQPWPELPEDVPVAMDNSRQVRRELEHLQRLEEEQRGTYGTGRLFD